MQPAELFQNETAHKQAEFVTPTLNYDIFRPRHTAWIQQNSIFLRDRISENSFESVHNMHSVITVCYMNWLLDVFLELIKHFICIVTSLQSDKQWNRRWLNVRCRHADQHNIVCTHAPNRQPRCQQRINQYVSKTRIGPYDQLHLLPSWFQVQCANTTLLE